MSTEQSRRRRQSRVFIAPHERVLTFAEWARLNRISKKTARNLIAAGNGPEVIRVSQRRLGITMAANSAWQASRVRRGARA
jgi:hypothetical protein